MLSVIAEKLLEQEREGYNVADMAPPEQGILLAPYKLPTKPEHLYKHQTESALKISPADVVHAANKWQAQRPLVSEPFERSLLKLPEHARPGEQGPPRGPLAHPNEPIWFEMQHQLQVILKRQGRRAERRKKRKLRSKLLRGRSRPAEMRNQARDLREYLDRKALEHGPEGSHAMPPGQAHGEFLGKVHERYLHNRDRLDVKPFRYRGTGGAVVDVYGIAQGPERAPAVVRPVYVPPPDLTVA